jgi:hypothetical protein
VCPDDSFQDIRLGVAGAKAQRGFVPGVLLDDPPSFPATEVVLNLALRDPEDPGPEAFAVL